MPSFPDTRKDGAEGLDGPGRGGTQVPEGRREQGGAQRLRFGRERGAADWAAGGGFTRARKTFRIRDVEVRTSYVDHND